MINVLHDKCGGLLTCPDAQLKQIWPLIVDRIEVLLSCNNINQTIFSKVLHRGLGCSRYVLNDKLVIGAKMIMTISNAHFNRS